MVICTVCKVEKEETEFAPSHRANSKSLCRPCNTKQLREWRSRNRESHNAYQKKYKARKPEIYRNAILKTKYGIGISEYEQMHIDQGGVCAICGKPETAADRRTKVTRKLSVDHCHNEGHVRGLLCGKCNPGIGLFMHDEGLLMKAIEYLQRTSR